MLSGNFRPGIVGLGAAALVLLCIAAAPVAAADGPAACPPKAARVVHSNGNPTVYNGTYPEIPDLCRMGPANANVYFYFGIWNSDWPGAGAAYPAMKTAIDGPPGTRVAFVTRSYPGLQWTDTIINEGPDPLTVGGQTYRTLKMAHEREGIEGNTYHSIITVWRDIPTGLALKVVEKQISGESYGPDTTWTATRVEWLP